MSPICFLELMLNFALGTRHIRAYIDAPRASINIRYGEINVTVPAGDLEKVASHILRAFCLTDSEIEESRIILASRLRKLAAMACGIALLDSAFLTESGRAHFRDLRCIAENTAKKTFPTSTARHW